MLKSRLNLKVGLPFFWINCRIILRPRAIEPRIGSTPRNQCKLIRWRGFNPTNQEKVNTGRRELLWGFAYNGIENLNSLMQEIYRKKRHLKTRRRRRTSFQSWFWILFSRDFWPIRNWWNWIQFQRLKALLEFSSNSKRIYHGNHKKLLMKLISEDIILLLKKIIAKIKSQ